MGVYMENPTESTEKLLQKENSIREQNTKLILRNHLPSYNNNKKIGNIWEGKKSHIYEQSKRQDI